MDPHISAKEEVKRTIDIVELVGQFVQLKRAGQNYLGLCPFHVEKEPSFTVSSSKQIFHCFGCRKGGDAIAFWMEYHKVSFPEALRDLAERYHVPLPSGPPGTPDKGAWAERGSLLKLNELACSHFHKILTQSPKGGPAREYLAKRGVTSEVVSLFRLGYAPDEWDGLTRVLGRQNLEQASKVGLVIPKRNGGYYDRFRGRIMYPIFDGRGRVLGFGGRVLDDSSPKYLNTPESPLFHKGRVLYGLHASLESIRQSGRVVIVEGYMDLLALRRHGFEAVVATLGTALTREHVRLLKGYAHEAAVVFDSDRAGKSAALRSLACFLEEGLAPKVLLLPENEDPDSFVNRQGLAAFLELLDRTEPLFDFFIDQRFSQAGNSIEGRIAVLKEVLPLLNELGNAAQRSFYVRRLAEKLGVHESSVLEEMARVISRRTLPDDESTLRERMSGSRVKSQDDSFLLNLLVHHPGTVDRMIQKDLRLLLTDAAVIEIYDAMVESYRKEEGVTPADLVDRLTRDSAREILREALLSSSICADEEVDQAIKEMGDEVHRRKIAESKSKALERGDVQRLNQIPKLKRNIWG